MLFYERIRPGQKSEDEQDMQVAEDIEEDTPKLKVDLSKELADVRFSSEFLKLCVFYHGTLEINKPIIDMWLIIRNQCYFPVSVDMARQHAVSAGQKHI